MGNLNIELFSMIANKTKMVLGVLENPIVLEPLTKKIFIKFGE